MNLQAAIMAAEAAQTNLASADGTQSAAQAKADSANASLVSAVQADKDATEAFNKAIDDLIAAATAAKR